MNSVAFLVPQAGQEDRPRTFFFGNSTDIAWCRDKCSMEPECLSFTLHLPEATFGYPTMCYGRGFGAPENLYPSSEGNAGVKLC